MILYLCPALMDWLLFYVVFAVLYAAGARGASMWQCALLGAAMQAAYMPGSFCAGSLLNGRNAKKILVWSALLCGLTSAVCLKLEGFLALLLAMAVFGAVSAFFFNSFQTFMRSESSLGMTLKESVSMYNFAWSLGAGAGCLTAGMIYALGQWALIGTALASTVAILALLAFYKGSGAARQTPDGVVEEGSDSARRVSPLYVVVGWLMMFTMQFAQRPVYTFLPPIFAQDGVNSFLASLPLFMFMAVQAVVALFMWRFRDLLYRRTPLLTMQCFGILTFLALWIWPQYWPCLAALSLLGVYSGFIFFCSVYYASNSPKSSFNIGVNEGLVGMGSIAGVFGGDMWMRHNGSGSGGIFILCAVAISIATVLQLALASVRKR